MFYSSNYNSRFQHSDDKSITIGSSEKGDSALFIGEYFKTGTSSAECETYLMNGTLSKSKNFSIKKFEVWGFNDI